MKKVFLDLGACRGESIRAFNKHWGDSDEYEIHSFEALPANYKTLKEAYGNKPNITLYNKAVYTEDTEITFYTAPPYGSSIYSDKITHINPDRYVKIGAIDISKFIENTFSKKDYIIMKFDIEGAEYDILPKLLDSGILQNYVNELYGEFHAGKIRSISKEIHNDLVDRVESEGFDVLHWSALGGGKIEGKNFKRKKGHKV